jgi:hypothetical protein
VARVETINPKGLIDARNLPSYSYFDSDDRATESIDANGFPSYTLYDDGNVTETIDARVGIDGLGDLEAEQQ